MLVIVLLLIDMLAGMVEFPFQTAMLGTRKLAAGQPVTILLRPNARVLLLKTVLLAAVQLVAPDALMDALLLLVQAGIDTVRMLVGIGMRPCGQECSQQQCRDKILGVHGLSSLRLVLLRQASLPLPGRIVGGSSCDDATREIVHTARAGYTDTMDALILFSHGSLLCGAGEALDAHAGRLKQRGVSPIVEVGYLNYSEPTFAQAVARCAAAGARQITVLPFFLVPGYFVTVSLPEQIERARAEFPALVFTVADAIGYDERLADALLLSAAEAVGPGHWRDDLAAAARGCRARPDCPLYATPDCPRVPAPGTPERPFLE